MMKSLAELRELQQLQNRLRDRLVASVPALVWFATRFARNGRIPLNTWHRLDRPLPKESEALGLAYDVWHAILRAERGLRLSHEAEADSLRRAAIDLKKRLDQLTAVPQRDGASLYARRITADEIYGTFNILSCASVLRAEVFPERSYSTPSYVAGHILMAELNAARRYAQTHSVSGIKERTPRLFAISQGVHAFTLYIDHLRKRATRFEAIASELDAIQSIHDTALTIPGGPHEDLEEALDTRLRTGMARLSALCDDAAELLVSTRAYFRHIRESLDTSYKNDTRLSLDVLRGILRSAAATLSARPVNPVPHGDRGVLAEQAATYTLATSFCTTLSDQISQASECLRSLLTAAVYPGATYASTLDRVTRLRDALDVLVSTHEAEASPMEFPSLRDASRFQVLERLTGLFRHSNADWASEDRTNIEEHRRTQRLVRAFRDSYGLGSLDQRLTEGQESEWASELCETIRQFGASALGRSVTDWWSNYAECYRCVNAESNDPILTSSAPVSSGQWLNLRHQSFRAISQLVNTLSTTNTISHSAKALRTAASTERTVAEAVEVEVKELTQWCRPRGHQLILAGQSDVSFLFDPLELISAMWIADMLGEPWGAKTEQAAFKVVAALQRADGTFPSVAPLYQNRGFTYYPPSASVVGLLARFVTRGSLAPKHQRLHTRLRLWEPVLRKGAGYLIESMIASESDSSVGPDTQFLAGWQSDRHPQNERIDCLATTEAVTAICRLEDALVWLLNLEAAAEFSVKWPAPAWQHALPSDGGRRNKQLLLTVSEMIRQLRGGTELYKAACGHVQGGHRRHAFVFYGPPGTGKTYSQELLAGELGWPLVTVTIGDVLRDGADLIGRRLLEIFERLGHLRNACIVFDEFDEMVTDRPRRRERGWAGLQLLTATMLPLLSTFRDQIRRQSCAVSFTTNYLENIDRAATRVGRVDAVELLAYPDDTSRTLLALVELDKRRTQASVQPRVSTSMEMIRRAVFDTAMCARPDVVRYLASLFDEGQRRVERPSSPIDATYYQLRSPVPDGVRQDLRTILNTIGPPHIRDNWLRQNSAWNRVRELSDWRKTERMVGGAHRPKALAVRTEQRTGPVPQAKLINFSHGGLRIETVAELPISLGKIEGARLKLRVGRHDVIAKITNIGGGGEPGSKRYGLEVVDNSDGWEALVAQWCKPARSSKAIPGDRAATPIA